MNYDKSKTDFNYYSLTTNIFAIQTNKSTNKRNMKKIKKENKKFDLDKMEVAKLKNLRVIVGGNVAPTNPTDTVDTDARTF
ncbi:MULTISPECIES: hypothetical protein [Flavobacterium]|jgi:hypothetical protein|uniref:Uncharacterized protein n=1 Tax=Flavobacterium cupriresistens TaxID=2893885 RepID=A0ABU4RF94_9FLAO|nr:MULTISPECIES: hypothetical protein [unclassified Flavobacterium]KLT68355.1 hypothetical protein AB674_18145 [Flavobacterium sp. ABG]MDX6191269.1 hypothetical protein [Flavobacterium sp. Fl-318]UFH42412.1 hypothetical protein LNP23_21715 [Flavobacterium sp. F-323]